jgi:serine/threonine-protein kinase
VVLKALAKDPANRFASAEEFLHALDAADADPTGGFLGDTASYAAVTAAAGAPPAQPPPPDGPPERRGFFTPARLIAMAMLLLVLAGVIAYALTRPESVLVPTVLGKTQQQAVAILGDAGFEVAVKSFANEAKPGTVLEQDPPAGSRIDEGSTVTISVSTGLGTVVVPDVAGQTEKQALKALRDKGLRPRVRERSSSTVRAGLAIGTIPVAGADLERGKPITLLVSTGPKRVQVPSVIGEQQDLAESQLRRVGLIPDVEPRNSDEPEGQVIAQDPGAGSTVEKHTRVTIVVSTGAGTAIVPNVVGESQDAAKASLKDSGLSVRIVKRTTTDENEDGQVLDQSPTAGTRLRRGEFVTIFVGKFKAPPTTTTTTPTQPPSGP